MVFNLSHDYQYMYMLLPTLLKGYKSNQTLPYLFEINFSMIACRVYKLKSIFNQ